MGKHSQRVNCNACGGSGKVMVSDNGNSRWVKCTVCNGAGKV